MSANQLIAGRFQKLESIGQGGMGQVYKGFDTLTNSPVAIKELRPEIVKDNPDLVVRFEREGETLRKLNHPNIVKLLGTAYESDHHYLIMDYVDGGSLRELLDRQRQLSVPDVLNIALDLSDAITRAHRLKIIHRDIKPANVLISKNGTPLLSDFGIARLDDSPDQMTETGVILGTLAYLPPEAIRGEQIDERVDVWAFGIMLYEMLAGARPFDGENAGALLNAILTSPPKDILKLRDGHLDDGKSLDWTLAGLIYWMLEKKRDERPSIRMVATLLDNLITGRALPTSWLGTDMLDTGKAKPHELVQQVRDISSGNLKSEDLMDLVEASMISQNEVQLETSITSQWTADPSISRSDWSIKVKRVLDHPPRIFISYRRADSVGVVGRIYDRLCAAYGETNIFKDVDKIPAGVNFKDFISSRIRECDVLLVVIGKLWLTAADENGRRLENPADFVRLEIETGLENPNVLVIPAILDGAEMPEARLLPPSLQALSYLNGAAIRNDPDFNRDIEWLIGQIYNSFEMKKLSNSKVYRRLMGGLIAALLLIFVSFGIYQFVANTSLNPTSAIVNFQATLVNPEHLRVLVAEPLRLSGEIQPNLQAEMVRSLQINFNPALITTTAEIFAYPAIIHDKAEAQTIAETYHAAVIIWGRYTSDYIEMEIQVGDLSVYSDITVSRTETESFSNATHRLSNPAIETLSYGVYASLNGVATVSNDIDLMFKNVLASEDFVGQASSVVADRTSGSYFHIYIANFYTTPQLAVQAMLDALRLEPRNPFLNSALSLAYMRVGNLEDALDTNNTALEFAPDGWFIPYVILANISSFYQQDNQATVEYLSYAIEIEPNNWFTRAFRGLIAYLERDFDLARLDSEAALANNPQINSIYAPALGLALRDADWYRAQDLYAEVVEKFPDPQATERLITAFANPDVIDDLAYIPYLEAWGNVTLKRWNGVISQANRAIEQGLNTNSDIYFILGFAHCNLENYAAAEAAYTQAIAIDPEWALLYGLRAEALRKQNRLIEAVRDLGVIARSAQADAYAPLVSAMQNNSLSCQNFLSADLAALGVPRRDN